MTLKELASKVAKLEGRKKEAPIGDIREIIAILSDIIARDPSVAELLLKNGKKRLRLK